MFCIFIALSGKLAPIIITTVTNNLDIFRKEFLEANTWTQRKDGVPLDLLEKLTCEELKIAEIELIKVVSLKDDWPIVGLGHIKSKDALPKLYDLLAKSKGPMKVTIAHSIFQICQDNKMIEIVLETMPRITNQYELINVLYYLPDFKDKRITELHDNYRNHKEYLVAYNATRYLGLPTNEVVEKFREKEKNKSIRDRLTGK
jgi:hypothetical protein